MRRKKIFPNVRNLFVSQTRRKNRGRFCKAEKRFLKDCEDEAVDLKD
jgi:hypothetical protein